MEDGEFCLHIHPRGGFWRLGRAEEQEGNKSGGESSTDGYGELKTGGEAFWAPAPTLSHTYTEAPTKNTFLEHICLGGISVFRYFQQAKIPLPQAETVAVFRAFLLIVRGLPGIPMDEEALLLLLLLLLFFLCLVRAWEK